MKRLLTLTIALMVIATAALAAWQDEGTLTAPASGDEVLVNDVSDTTDDAAGTVKRMEFADVAALLARLLADGDTLGLATTETTDGDEWCIQIYDVDGTTWLDCLCFTNGNTPAVTLGAGCQIDGIALNMPTLDADELTDTSDPHTLVEAELMGTVLTNGDSTGADEWDFPARTEGWNFIFVIEAAQNACLDPNGTENWYLNGSANGAGTSICNTSPTAGESIYCYSTETAVYCESKYTDWSQGS